MKKIKEFKKSYIIISLILTILLIVLFLNVIIFKKTSFILLSLLVTITFVTILLIYGYERKKRRFQYESIFYVFAFSTLFLIGTYIIGLFVGFNKNVYTLSIKNIFKNILPYLILILSSEYLRYEISRKGEKSFVCQALVFIIMVVIDATIFLTTFDLNTIDGEIMYISSIIIPSIFKNVFLSMLVKHSGPYSPMLYRIIMDLKIVIVPIVPNFGVFIDSIVNTIIPITIGGAIYVCILPYRHKDVKTTDVKKSPLYRYLLVSILGILVLGIIILVSCKFKYGLLSIGSGSMTGTINKGDAIIYEVIDDSTLKENDILVFRKEGRIVVHRIINIVRINESERVYYTKGDYNETEDGYPILKSDIVGIVKYRIKYIGLPSIVLRELLNK